MGAVDVTSRVSMSEVTTYGWTLEQDVEGYAAHGFTGIELWLNKVTRNGAPYDRVPSDLLTADVGRSVAEILAHAGLQATSLVCAGLFTDVDADAHARRIAHLRSTVRFAGELGSPAVLVVPGNLNGASRAQAVERTAHAITEVVEEAAELGVDLAIEPLRTVHTDFVNTIPDAMEIVERVSHPRCGLCLDTYQLWRGESSYDALMQELRAAASWARVVQVADSAPVPRSTEDRKIPGEGALPLTEMLAAILASGYDGWWAVEIMSRELWAGDPEDLLERCRTGMSSLLADARRIAAHSAADGTER